MKDIFLACFNGRRTGRIFRVACFQAQDKAHEFYDRNSFDFCISNFGNHSSLCVERDMN